MSSSAQKNTLNFASKGFAGAETTFASSAKILVAMTLTMEKDLRFGTIMVTAGNNASGGSVLLNPKTGILQYSTGLAKGTNDNYDTGATPAEFKITGSPSNTYGVMLPSNSIVVTNTQGALTAEQMTISDLTLSFDGGDPVAVASGVANTSIIGSTLDNSHVGTSVFKLGGTLIVTAKQAGGTYENNSTTIFVDYN
jgi:hypothetical protein